MKEEKILQGLVAAPFTPFDAADNINLDQVQKLVNLYNQNGVSGAFIAGTTGEGASLSQQEKLTLLKTWSAMKGSDLKTIFMLGGNCIKDMQALAQAAQEHQYDAVSMISPYYFKPAKLEHLIEFCAQVLEPVPEMPFYYYHIPSMTGVHFPMLDFMKQASSRIPGFHGIKFTAPHLMDFHQCCMHENGRYEMLWGTDEALLSALPLGASGAVGSTYNYMAPLYKKIIAYSESGDFRNAEKHQRKSIKVVEQLIKFGGLATGKAIMEMVGVDCGPPRSPNIGLSADDKKSLKIALEAINFFDYCSSII